MTAAQKYKTFIVRSRRDPRAADSAFLHHACRRAEHVVPLFPLEEAIIKQTDAGMARVASLFDALAAPNRNLRKRTGRLIVRRGWPPDALLQAVRDLDADGVSSTTRCSVRPLTLYQKAAQKQEHS